MTNPPIPEGWIRHDGGPCPVAPETVVDVMIYCGKGVISDDFEPRPAGKLGWKISPHLSGAIIAYRPHVPALDKDAVIAELRQVLNNLTRLAAFVCLAHSSGSPLDASINELDAKCEDAFAVLAKTGA
jgi:hypothetical protein